MNRSRTQPSNFSKARIKIQGWFLITLCCLICKPQANLSIDPYGSEDVDLEDPIGRLEMLKKTHNSLVFDWAINCPGIRALPHKF